MLPTKLVLSSFGSYAKETIIDFSLLGSSGLYLVTGDTGSGKTTIFDAICYALYGEASGQNRKDSMFKTSYKYNTSENPSENITFVELFFNVHGKSYRVKRTQEYFRAKKRGEGFVEVPAEIELYLPDGEIISKLVPVNKKILEILGIDKNQFTQISMIAQGEFLKLLLATTKERQEIFRKLFDTKKFLRLQESLKEHSSSLKKSCDNLQISIHQYVSGILIYEENTKKNIQINDGKTKILSEDVEFLKLEELLPKLEEWIDIDEEKSANIQTEISDLYASILKLTEQLAKCSEIKKIDEAISSAYVNLESEKKKFSEAESLFENQLQDKISLSESEKHLAKLNDELPNYSELTNNINSLHSLKNQSVDMAKNLNTLSSNENQIRNNISKYKNELSLLRNSGIEFEKKSQFLNKLTERVEFFSKLARKYKTYTDTLNKFDLFQNSYKFSRDEYESKRNSYEIKYKLYLDTQAGILANNLKDDEPCPVCGSTTHPKLAELSDSSLTREELDSLKKIVQVSQDEMNVNSNNCKNCSDKCKELEFDILEESAVLLEKTIENLDELPKILEVETKDLELEIKKLSTELKTIGDNKKYFEKLEVTIPKEEFLYEQTKAQIQANTLEMSKIEMSIANAEKTISNLQGNLSFLNEEEARKNILLTENNLVNLKSSLAKTQKDYDLAKENLDLIKGEISALKKQKDNFEEINFEFVSKQKSIFEEKKLLLETSNTEIIARLTQNKNTFTDLSAQISKLQTTERKYENSLALSNTALGKLSGKEKIMLETFVQITFFNKVLERANLRLMLMTSGQYELRRRKDLGVSGNGGLDLDVFDYYTGSLRDVKTLSGGEAFKASLCLALGLSDEIQSSVGGIEIGTMFIDEGFGSLDEESLDNSIKTLINLSDNGRLIGIISHVSELKERIEKQIIVKKDKNNGSTAKISV